MSREPKTCLIIGASGNVYAGGPYDYIICADGGLASAARLGLKPDLLIGDMDSLEGPRAAVKTITLPAEKDFSDLEAGVKHGLSMGCADLSLTGCTGGRQDHFLAALFLLKHISGAGARGRIIDDDNEIMFYDRPLTLAAPLGFKYFSVIPISAALSGVTITGAKYPLNKARVARSASLALSNEPVPGAAASIEIGRGEAVIVLSGRM